MPVIGFCGAPWTVATYMVEGRGSKDQAEARLWAYRDPSSFQALIDLLVETSIGYLLGQVEAGAGVLQIFDSWAGGLPEDEFARWCIAPTSAIVAAVKTQAPDVPVIGFPRGCGALAQVYASETGIDAIGCDTGMPLGFMRESLQSRLPVQGNLDPLLLLAGGSHLDDAWTEILNALEGPTVRVQSRSRYSPRHAAGACRASRRAGEGQGLAIAMLLSYTQGLPRHCHHRLDGWAALSAAAFRLSRGERRKARRSLRHSR